MLRPNAGPLPHTSHLADIGISPLLTAMLAYCTSYCSSPSTRPAIVVVDLRLRSHGKPRALRCHTGTAVPHGHCGATRALRCHTGTAVLPGRGPQPVAGVARTLLVPCQRCAVRP